MARSKISNAKTFALGFMVAFVIMLFASLFFVMVVWIGGTMQTDGWIVITIILVLAIVAGILTIYARQKFKLF